MMAFMKVETIAYGRFLAIVNFCGKAMYSSSNFEFLAENDKGNTHCYHACTSVTLRTVSQPDMLDGKGLIHALLDEY